MTSHDGRYTITFNGEIYNAREIRAALPNYPFRTTCDTEVLLAAYQEWERDCVRNLNGMFAFAIWDSERKVLFCARDRLGQKPLYWAWVNGNFACASEIKALLAAGHPVSPNPR